MRFTKMQGLGNDYVYVNGFETDVPDPAGLARVISDRHFGVGSDGLILILPSEAADLRMEMWNADGSRAEMCGNGLRCVGFYALRNGLVKEPGMVVETGAGLLDVAVLDQVSDREGLVRIVLGEPGLGPETEEEIEVAGRTVTFTAVSMGNPHAVTFVPEVESYPVETVGPAVEVHPRFPNRVNVEFVERVSEAEVIQRTWERGTGETMACGTGAAAVAVAGRLTGRTGSPLTVHLLGGDLRLEWDGEGAVRQTGPATIVFEGEW